MSLFSKSPLNPFPMLRYDAPVHSEGADDAPASPSGAVDPHAGTADMEVHGLGSNQKASFHPTLRPVTSLRPEGKRPDSTATNTNGSTLAPKDSVEISAASRAAGKAVPSLRAERLAQIKASIEDGSYDTPERLEAALDRMFSQIGVWDD